MLLAGRTRTPLSRQGQSDFHALSVSDAGALPFDEPLVRSADGLTWEELGIPAPTSVLTASPDGSWALATTQQGLLRSTDTGSTWAQMAQAPVLQVVDRADGRNAAGVTPDRTVWASADGGGSWQEVSRLDAAPEAVPASADDDGMRIVVTRLGVVESLDGGSTFRVLLSAEAVPSRGGPGLFDGSSGRSARTAAAAVIDRESERRHGRAGLRVVAGHAHPRKKQGRQHRSGAAVDLAGHRSVGRLPARLFHQR